MREQGNGVRRNRQRGNVLTAAFFSPFLLPRCPLLVEHRCRFSIGPPLLSLLMCYGISTSLHTSFLRLLFFPLSSLTFAFIFTTHARTRLYHHTHTHCLLTEIHTKAYLLASFSRFPSNMGHLDQWRSRQKIGMGKGARCCVICSNQKALIRKYELNVCRQCFRENAEHIGFTKLR